MELQMNKKEIIKAIKEDIVFYAQPRNMASRPKHELVSFYLEASKYGLLKSKENSNLTQKEYDINEMSKQEIEHSAEQYTNYNRGVLSTAIEDGKATAEHFETYIAKEGLDMWVIALISEYFVEDISYEDRKEVRMIVHGGRE